MRHEWSEEERDDLGYIESAQQLVNQDDREWGRPELLRTAGSAESRNTGWPIGLVIQRPGMAPVPTAEGIEARVQHYRSTSWQDFWAFHTDGSYYVIRLLEEDFEPPSFSSSRGHPERSIWFDVRIWRIAEVLLHSATLYRELGVPPDEPYLLAIKHGGLTNREFYVSTAGSHVSPGRICRTPEASWEREITQDYITSNIQGLVGEVASGLFELFDFRTVNQAVVEQIVDQFIRRS